MCVVVGSAVDLGQFRFAWDDRALIGGRVWLELLAVSVPRPSALKEPTRCFHFK